MSISESEIAPHGHQDMITLVDVKHLINLCCEQITLPVGIEGFKVFIVNNWAVSIEAIIPPETIKVAVVIVHCVGVDLGGRVQMIKERLPNELH